jgi:hypothetical protein
MPLEAATESGTEVPILQSCKQKTVLATEFQSSDLEQPPQGTTGTKSEPTSPASGQQGLPETNAAIGLVQTRQN